MGPPWAERRWLGSLLEPGYPQASPIQPQPRRRCVASEKAFVWTCCVFFSDTNFLHLKNIFFRNKDRFEEACKNRTERRQSPRLPQCSREPVHVKPGKSTRLDPQTSLRRLQVDARPCVCVCVCVSGSQFCRVCLCVQPWPQ